MIVFNSTISRCNGASSQTEASNLPPAPHSLLSAMAGSTSLIRTPLRIYKTRLRSYMVPVYLVNLSWSTSFLGTWTQSMNWSFSSADEELKKRSFSSADQRIFHLFDQYETCFGLKVNYTKTEAMWIGLSWNNRGTLGIKMDQQY